MKLEYKILEDGDINCLASEVTKAINDDWSPLGGIATYADKRYEYGQAVEYPRFVQAIMKEIE